MSLPGVSWCLPTSDNWMLRHKFFTNSFTSRQLGYKYRYYSYCSGAFLQDIGGKINAKGSEISPFAVWRVEPQSLFGEVRIRSEVTGQYLCFNKKSRITMRHSRRSTKCLFKELSTANHYLRLQSVWRPRLLLGFNKKGKFIHPRRTRKLKGECFQFLKDSVVQVSIPQPSTISTTNSVDNKLQNRSTTDRPLNFVSGTSGQSLMNLSPDTTKSSTILSTTLPSTFGKKSTYLPPSPSRSNFTGPTPAVKSMGYRDFFVQSIFDKLRPKEVKLHRHKHRHHKYSPLLSM